MLRRCLFIALALVISCASRSKAQVIIGSIEPYRSETSHPYPTGTDQRPAVTFERISFPAAKFLRVHFVDVSLAPGDYLSVSGANGSELSTYTGKGPDDDGDFWTFDVAGNEIDIAVHGGPNPGYGYRIEELGIGDVDLDDLAAAAKESCPDTRENVICHVDNDPFWTAQKAVAYLIFRHPEKDRDDALALCTGWIVANPHKVSFVMTNYHCINQRKQLKTVRATFGRQADKCKDGKVDDKESKTYMANAGSLLKGDRDLDYSIIELKPNDKKTAEEEWGAITPLTREPKMGEDISIPQAPDKVKVVAWWEDVEHKKRCAVERVFSAINELWQPCKVSEGSSGSPVLDAGGDVIGLARVKAKDSTVCGGAATTMKAICKDASSFINCDGKTD